MAPIGEPPDLSNRLEEIVAGFGIGATITPEEVLSALALEYPSYRVLSVSFGGGATSVPLNANEIGTTRS
jgi:hypothetical protein